MNERIRAIWNQAASSHSQAEHSWQTKENFIERFAELIVKDCVKAVDGTNTHHAHTTFDLGLIATTIAKSKQSILEHFGVENEYYSS